MDFDTQTLVGTIPAPVAVRAIAYDSDQDAFWVGNNWSADLRLVDRTGTQLAALTPAVGSFSGLAYDNLSGTPTLWGHVQTGTYSGSLAQIDMASGAVLQSLVFSETLFPGITSDYSSGGLEIVSGLVPGTATLLGHLQNWKIYGMELCTIASWLTTTPRNGTVAPGGSVVVDVNFDATETDPGTHNANLVIMNNAGAAVEVPVELTITGDWPAEFSIDEPTWHFGDMEEMNPSMKRFTITNTGGSTPAPLIINTGGIYLSGDAEGNFSVNAPDLPVTLNHGENYSFEVTFVPQSVGAKSATLNIEDNLVTRNIYPVSLVGNGIAEQIDLVVNLNGSLQGVDTVDLTWAMYDGVPGEPGWIHYDDGNNNDGIGTGSGNVVFDVAAKFDSGTMYAYTGMEISRINYYPCSANTNYTIKIWTGIDGSIAPETLVYSQPHVPTVGQWNEVLLTTPVPIAGNQAVWIGYECDVTVVDANTDNYHPAGCDAGPASAGYGDLICLGTWESMAASYSLNYNWNLQAYMSDPIVRGVYTPLLSIPVESGRMQSSRHTFSSASGNNSVRALRGFNVYRDAVQLNAELLTQNTYTDIEVPVGTHDYTVQAVYYSANSPMSDPFQITVLPPVPLSLPFMEDWSSEDYETNLWQVSAANWVINTEIGLVAPCASFSWSPQILDYTEYLTSFYIDGTGHTALKLKFDLALDNYSTDAENTMSPEIWTESSGIWTTLDTFSSLDNEGAGWQLNTFVYDISALAAGEIFRIRFKAWGEDSYEIDFWYLDNIVVEDIPDTLANPELNVVEVDGVIELSFSAVPGTDWYLIYGGDDPYNLSYMGDWQASAGNSIMITPAAKEFYQVKACSMVLPATRMNAELPRPKMLFPPAKK